MTTLTFEEWKATNNVVFAERAGDTIRELLKQSHDIDLDEVVTGVLRAEYDNYVNTRIE